MVAGIGIDLCGVERMKKALQSEHFKERIFSPEEISYCESKGRKRFESYAAGFAAREAFCKASGKTLSAVMFGGNFTLTRNNDGVPSVKLSGNLAMPGAKIFVSLTHEGGFACAVVVIDKEGEY
ncbi:MAG: holo-ACP synthase [Synergistaceae bacterium]|nr:holo-ACP synthase [Synergistaceae bacterium]MBR0150700.1 holo-ACP synthase [Synergistaceae bacterium]